MAPPNEIFFEFCLRKNDWRSQNFSGALDCNVMIGEINCGLSLVLAVPIQKVDVK